MFPKGQLALELLLDVLGQHFVLLQTFDDLLIERGELADFILERALDVIFAKNAEIAEANELCGSQFGRCDLMNSASEGRTFSPMAPFCGRKARPQIWQFSFRDAVASIVTN
jgi:hypothetical protein